MRCFDGHKVVKFEDIKWNSEQYINENNEKTDTNNDYNCGLCTKTFTKKWHLNVHVEQEHDKKKVINANFVVKNLLEKMSKTYMK